MRDLHQDVSARQRLSQLGDAVEIDAVRAAADALRQRDDSPRRPSRSARRDSPRPGTSVPVPGAGVPLADAERSRWEHRFDHDLAHVRIHTGQQADDSARSFAARAYATGPHIVFRAGEFAPGTSAGTRLLAHELAHVAQGRDGVHREPSAEDLSRFDAIVASIRGWKTFTDMEDEHQAMFERVVTEARQRENAMYYAAKLEALFKIPSPAALSRAEKAQLEQETIERNRGRIGESLEEEAAQSQQPGYESGAEEAAADERDAKKSWVPRQGDGATYRVDASDYHNIVVQLKLHLVPRQDTKTTGKDIENMAGIEQGVERAAARVGGYLFDLRFVNVDGPDVFRITVDIGKWPTSGNVVGGAATLVHEVHHLLNLPDRYDYIEAHAENEAMSVQYRLRLFERQMARGVADPLGPYSLMEEGGPKRQLTDEDVCLVADPAHAEECIAARNGAELQRVRLRAWNQAIRVWNGLVDVMAGGNPTATADLERLTGIVFGEAVPVSVMASRARAMVNTLGSGLHFNVVLSTSPAALEEELGLTNRGNRRCQQVPLWAGNGVDVVSGGGVPSPSISICSHALMADEQCVTQSMLAASAELTGLLPYVGSGCPYYECTRPSGIGAESADSWAQFVYCFSKALGGV